MSLDPDAAEFADPVIAHAVLRERRPPAGIDIWLGANSHGEMGWSGSHSLSLALALEQTGAWGATMSHDAHRSLRRIWATRDPARR
jgi:hypothetical protein